VAAHKLGQVLTVREVLSLAADGVYRASAAVFTGVGSRDRIEARANLGRELPASTLSIRTAGS
jgi:hypothetical protein